MSMSLIRKEKNTKDPIRNQSPRQYDFHFQCVLITSFDTVDIPNGIYFLPKNCEIEIRITLRCHYGLVSIIGSVRHC